MHAMSTGSTTYDRGFCQTASQQRKNTSVLRATRQLVSIRPTALGEWQIAAGYRFSAVRVGQSLSYRRKFLSTG
jgi:hypothetical protein